MVVTSATALTPLADPFKGLRSEAREAIIFKPMSRDERQLMRGSRGLPAEQRRVVAHYIITTRRAEYEHDQAYRIREAQRARAQDVVDDENRRIARHSDYLGRRAESEAAEGKTHPAEPVRAPAVVPEEQDLEEEDEMGM